MAADAAGHREPYGNVCGTGGWIVGTDEWPDGQGDRVGLRAGLTCTGVPPSSSSSWAVRMADAATSSCVDWAPCLQGEVGLSAEVCTEPGASPLPRAWESRDAPGYGS